MCVYMGVHCIILSALCENVHNKMLGGKEKIIITIVIYGTINLTHYSSQLQCCMVFKKLDSGTRLGSKCSTSTHYL